MTCTEPKSQPFGEEALTHATQTQKMELVLRLGTKLLGNWSERAFFDLSDTQLYLSDTQEGLSLHAARNDQAKGTSRGPGRLRLSLSRLLPFHLCVSKTCEQLCCWMNYTVM